MAESGGVQELWQEYKRDGVLAARDELILHYAGLVKYVAARLAAELPVHVTRADLASYGVFGLIDAIGRFEPDRGLKFESYAIARIRGAIIDELRAIDWVPRSVRTKARAVEDAFRTLEASLHRPPTDDELAGALDLTEAQLRRTLGDISRRSTVSLDATAASGDRWDSAESTEIAVDLSEGPAEVVEGADVRLTLAKEISRLPERDKVMLSLYYFEGLTLAQIGSVLGVTESRVSQMHTKAVLQLRSRMTAEEPDPARR